MRWLGRGPASEATAAVIEVQSAYRIETVACGYTYIRPHTEVAQRAGCGGCLYLVVVLGMTAGIEVVVDICTLGAVPRV